MGHSGAQLLSDGGYAALVTAGARCDRAVLERPPRRLARMRLVPSDLAEGNLPLKDPQQSAQSTTGKASRGFTDEERAAMQERAQALKAAARRGPRAGKADAESDVLAKIAELPEADRALTEREQASIATYTLNGRVEPMPTTPGPGVTDEDAGISA